MSLKYSVTRTVNDISYYLHNRWHRLDGPSIIYEDGDESYYQYGVHHRENGPAINHTTDGFTEYYLRGSNVVESVRSWVKYDRRGSDVPA